MLLRGSSFAICCAARTAPSCPPHSPRWVPASLPHLPPLDYLVCAATPACPCLRFAGIGVACRRLLLPACCALPGQFSSFISSVVFPLPFLSLGWVGCLPSLLCSCIPAACSDCMPGQCLSGLEGADSHACTLLLPSYCKAELYWPLIPSNIAPRLHSMRNACLPPCYIAISTGAGSATPDALRHSAGLGWAFSGWRPRTGRDWAAADARDAAMHCTHTSSAAPFTCHQAYCRCLQATVHGLGGQ